MATYIETKVISLNSESASQYNNGSFLSNMVFSLSTLLKDEPDTLHKQLTLANAQIPVSFYIVNYTNNQFLFTTYPSGSPVLNIITIPVGNYNSSSLISVLTDLFLAISVVMTITISKITGDFTFSSTSNYAFNSTSVLTTANQILGLNKASNLVPTLVGGDYVATCPFACNLLGIKQLMIKSNIISANNFSTSSNGQTTLIATIPVDSGAWSMINYVDTGGSKISFNNATLDEIDILILDAETNKEINFSNANWTMTILLHITKKLDLTKVTPTLGEIVDRPVIPKIEKLNTPINLPLSKDEQELKILEQ